MDKMNYHKPNVLSTLQSYGPEYQQFCEAIKEATVEELEKALTVISQKSRLTRITAELNRRKKGKGGA